MAKNLKAQEDKGDEGEGDKEFLIVGKLDGLDFASFQLSISR